MNGNPDSPLAQAQLALARGQFDQAAACYRTVLSLAPDDQAALIGLGNALCLAGRPDDAIAAYCAVLARSPGNLDVRHFLDVAQREVLFIQQMHGALSELDDEICRRDRLSLARGLGRRFILVGQYFDFLVGQHGTSFESTSNHSADYHQASLALLRSHIEQLGRPCTVNDIGCGYGAFFDQVQDLLVPADGAYRGYDVAPRMIAVARQRATDRRAAFEVSAVPTRVADYSVVAGTFNLRLDHDPEEWLLFVYAQILAMSKTSRHGFSFNMLTEVADRALFAARRGLILDFIRHRVGGGISVSEDYFDVDWIVQVSRG